MDQLYEVPDTVLEETGGDNALMAAWRLGQDMAAVLASGGRKDPAARPVTLPVDRLSALLRREADPGGTTLLAADMGSARLARNLEQLEWLRRGLEGEPRG